MPVAIAWRSYGERLVNHEDFGAWRWCYLASCIEPLSQHFSGMCFDAKGCNFSEKLESSPEQPGHQVIELERIIRALCDPTRRYSWQNH